MKLIVGLGNMGKEYENTRHNIGFMLLDSFAIENNISINKKGFKGLYYKGVINNQEIILLKPQTYMNLSGESVIEVVNYYKIQNEDILILYDDIDLGFSSIRIREKGSSGGHKGIKSIIDQLGTSDIKRIRFGIGKEKDNNVCDYVLGKFSTDEINIVNEKKEIINNILKDFLSLSFNKVMSKYN